MSGQVSCLVKQCRVELSALQSTLVGLTNEMKSVLDSGSSECWMSTYTSRMMHGNCSLNLRAAIVSQSPNGVLQNVS